LLDEVSSLLDVVLSQEENYSGSSKDVTVNENSKYLVITEVQGHYGKPFCGYFGVILIGKNGKQMGRRIRWLNDLSGVKLRYLLVFTTPSECNKIRVIYRINNETPIKSKCKFQILPPWILVFEAPKKLDDLYEMTNEYDFDKPYTFAMQADADLKNKILNESVMEDNLNETNETVSSVKPDCILIRGNPNSGKTFVSLRLKANLDNPLLIGYDGIINLVAETVRLYFENRIKPNSLANSTPIFDHEEEVVGFRREVETLISKNEEFFKKIYLDIIKDSTPNSEFRKYGKGKSSLIPLGDVGDRLKQFSEHIFCLVLKYVVKWSSFFMIEGYYFMKSEYLDSVVNNCHKVLVTDCIFEPAENVTSYRCDEKNFKNLPQLEEFVRREFSSTLQKYDTAYGGGDDIVKFLNLVFKIAIPISSTLNKPIELKALFNKGKIHGKEHQLLIELTEQGYLHTRASKKQYQTFSQKDTAMSNSFAKLSKLGIPDDLRNKMVLDLGCNEGFFCFECEKRGARVIGIENDPYWFRAAIRKKETIPSTVIFLKEDWNHINQFEYRFDLVLFLSSFHYTGDKMEEVLKKIYDVMNDEGFLILEAGLSDLEEGKYYIEKKKRPTGDVPSYPNKYTIRKLLENAGFEKIQFYGDSCGIRDVLPRYVIHAYKK